MPTPPQTPAVKRPAKVSKKAPIRQWALLILCLAVLIGVVAGLLYWNRPTAEVAVVVKGRAVSAVYGTVKVEWSVVQPVRAQNRGFIQLAPGIYDGVSSIGTLVKKDQLLASIVDEETARAIRQFRIDLTAATDRQRIGPPSAKLLKTAEDSLSRLEALQVQTQNVPRAQLEEARNSVSRLQDVVRTEKIELDRVVDNLTNQVRSLQEKLGRSEVKSPIDGVLTGVLVVDGELVFENNTLFNVALNSTYINGQVNEEDVGALRQGMKATVKLYSYPNQEFLATLGSVLPTGDSATQRYTVILSFDDPPANLMSGMTGEMNIILGEKEGALLIPARALLPGVDAIQDRVLVVGKDGVVTLRAVEVGFRSLEKVEVRSALAEGDWVIVADQDLFKPGDRVRPVEVSGAPTVQ
jgi:RND family efflux transporter MFP subunit